MADGIDTLHNVHRLSEHTDVGGSYVRLRFLAVAAGAVEVEQFVAYVCPQKLVIHAQATSSQHVTVTWSRDKQLTLTFIPPMLYRRYSTTIMIVSLC